jgi:hypothetical protein
VLFTVTRTYFGVEVVLIVSQKPGGFPKIRRPFPEAEWVLLEVNNP